MVFCMMNTLTTNKMAISTADTTLTMLRTVIKPWASSRESLTSAMPLTARMAASVSTMRDRSSR